MFANPDYAQLAPSRTHAPCFLTCAPHRFPSHQTEGAASEERFVAIVEEDLQVIGRWVTLQSESLHNDLAKLLKDCSDKTYAVDYLRGAPQRAIRSLHMRANPASALSAPSFLQTKLTRLGA
jgi:hypothetical protein